MKVHRRYVVVYRIGGTERCEWRKTILFHTREEATEIAERTIRAGYKALVHDADMLAAIGMPEGWEA